MLAKIRHIFFPKGSIDILGQIVSEVPGLRFPNRTSCFGRIEDQLKKLMETITVEGEQGIPNCHGNNSEYEDMWPSVNVNSPKSLGIGKASAPNQKNARKRVSENRPKVTAYVRQPC